MDQLEYAQAKQDYALGRSSFNPDAKSSFSVPSATLTPTVDVPSVSAFPTSYSNNAELNGNGPIDPNYKTPAWQQGDALSNTMPNEVKYGNTSGTDLGVTMANTDITSTTAPAWDYKDYATAGQIGLGAGQLGLGLASYLTQSKVADKQMRQMDQQYATNEGLIADRKANQAANANFASTFAKAK
jgi:hypothetical protein